MVPSSEPRRGKSGAATFEAAHSSFCQFMKVIRSTPAALLPVSLLLFPRKFAFSVFLLPLFLRFEVRFIVVGMERVTARPLTHRAESVVVSSLGFQHRITARADAHWKSPSPPDESSSDEPPEPNGFVSSIISFCSSTCSASLAASSFAACSARFTVSPVNGCVTSRPSP